MDFQKNSMKINVDEDIVLELTSTKYVSELFKVIENDREYLSEFLPWVEEIKEEKDLFEYISKSVISNEEKKEISFTILFKGKPVGRIGLHHLNLNNKNAAIGYWLDKKKNGNGIVIKSCIKLIEFGFKNVDLNRIEIKAAVSNIKSQAIPQKLNFYKEGVLRQAEFVNGEFVDLLLFSLLKEESRLITNN